MTATVAEGADMSRPGHPAWVGTLGEFALVGLIAALVHALVLKFVFPGFYNPFWPNHSDHYLAPDIAHSPLATMFSFTRPVGFAFFYLTGQVGARFALLCDLLLVLANCALTAMFVRRLAGIGPTYGFIIAAVVYDLLIFAHPLQYTWSTYDVFSQLSYLFVISGLLIGLRGAPFWALFGVFMLAFLSKETYVLSLGLFVGAWWLSRTGAERRPPLRIGLAIAASFAISLVYSRLFKSDYLGHGASPSSPYHVDASPKAVAAEWLRYASEGMTPALWIFAAAVAIAAAVLAWRTGRLTHALAALAFGLAGLLAWLPNAVLPNHHFAGYVWNGAYLIFAPLILLAPLAAMSAPMRALFVGIMALGLLSPINSKQAYKVNAWSIEQQNRQKRLISGIRTRFAALAPTTRRVLVTGLDFPFSPFDHGNALYEYSPRPPRFSVVAYTPRAKEDGPPTPVDFVSPEAAARLQVDEIWAFGGDGGMKAPIAMSPADAAALSAIGVETGALAIYPEVGQAFELDKMKPGGRVNLDSYHLLLCGGAFLNYKQYEAALRCLRASLKASPVNPYADFFSGQAYQGLGRMAEARASYARAVATDDKTHPNPAFKDTLARVEALAR